MIRLLVIGLINLATLDNDADWARTRSDRDEAASRYLRAASKGYDWFAYAMHGEPAGTPFIVLRVLPELAPDIWGRPEERFARFGFFDDPADPQRPLPLGLGWVLDPVQGDAVERTFHSATLTCAACHVGRVRVAPGQFKVLIGGPNTEIDVRKFRRAVELTVDRYIGTEADLKATTGRIAGLVKARGEDKNCSFFGGRYGIDREAEARERARFEDPAFVATVLADLARRVRGGRAAVVKQLATSYSKSNAPPLDGGSPGQSDGTGDLMPKFLLGREILQGGDGDPVQRFLGKYYPEMPFRNATVTDNPSVWRQADRPYGQLDGSIRAPLVRNVAAQTAVVGSSRGINVRNADIAARFTAELPPPAYPFAVDAVRARRGAELFRRHCQACHRAGNGAAYGAALIDTDWNRARVLSAEGRDLLLRNFQAAIPPDYEATAADGTKYKIAPDDIVNDRVRPDLQGYVAGPLDGVWARAPYLHNGSVPTLRHLLAPRNPESRRPEVFVRGLISYDWLNVGFEWDPRLTGTMVDEAPTAVLFDTSWDSASNRGHDRDVMADDEGQAAAGGTLRRLDWSGPEHRSNLEDLLEYLKTL